MNRSIARRRAALFTLAPAVLSLTACFGDDLGPSALPARGSMVLDGFVQPGLTLVADTGTATTRLPFGAPTEFDADEFTLRNDTVLAVSSRAAGDLLYIASLAGGTVRRVQLPPSGNPGRARLLPGGNGAALVGVALRDSGSVVLVRVDAAGTGTAIGRLAGAGRCPMDLARVDGATWVLDANARCVEDYRVEGAVRLIRIPDQGTGRDTIVLAGLRGSDARMEVNGDVAWVSAGGEADFSGFPFTLVSPGAVARVDLRGRRVLGIRSMPAGSYGADLRRGRDGFLYVSAYQDLTTFRPRVLQLRADDLTPVGASTAPWRTLVDAQGGEVTCSSATADAPGRLHCLRSGAAAATSLLVFSPQGTLLRAVAAGQGGVDLDLR